MRIAISYVIKVLRHWVALTLGGAVPTALTIVYSIIHGDVPIVAWVCCLVCGLVFAQGMAYRELDRQCRTRATRQGLQAAIQVGEDLRTRVWKDSGLLELDGKVISAWGYRGEDWSSRVEAWIDLTKGQIRLDIGEAEAMQFVSDAGLTIGADQQLPAGEHREWILRIDRRLQQLVSIRNGLPASQASAGR
jgi:hypothetical protein